MDRSAARPRTLLALALAASLLVAGCVADPGSGDAPPTGTSGSTTLGTSTPPESSHLPSTHTAGTTSLTTYPDTATLTTYPDTVVTFPGGPKERPPIPDSLSNETVRQFVHDFEYRYVYNTLWMGEGTDVSNSCEVHWVEPHGDGYEALVSCTAYANYGGEPTGNGTATSTVVHSDWFTQWFVYYVDENSVVRRQATEDERNRAN